MANRFSNTKHVHFTHSNSKFCLNSYESDIPMFSLIIIQRHPKTYKTLLVRLSCVHAFHASEASRISEIFPCLPFLFLYSYLQFCLSSFLARPLSDIWCPSPFFAKWTFKSIWRGNTGSYTASSREACGAAFALIHGFKNWTSYVEDRTCL